MASSISLNAPAVRRPERYNHDFGLGRDEPAPVKIRPVMPEIKRAESLCGLRPGYKPRNKLFLEARDMTMPKEVTKTVARKNDKSLERPDISFTDSTMKLKAKIKACDPEVQNYVSALEAEKLKLQKQVAQHQVKEITLNNRIKILESELTEERKSPKVKDLLKEIYEKPQPLIQTNSEELRKLLDGE